MSVPVAKPHCKGCGTPLKPPAIYCSYECVDIAMTTRTAERLKRQRAVFEPCDACGNRGPYELGKHQLRRVPHNGEMEWDTFPICDECAGGMKP